MDVHIFNHQTNLLISVSNVERLVREALSFLKVKTEEVSIYFVTVEEIADLHGQFFDDPTPTDCISFPMDHDNEEPYSILGEVFVCPQVAIDYVQQYSSTDFSHTAYIETTLYIIHGLLHLIGYDDIQEEECVQMRRAEARVMQYLTESNCVLRSE